MLNHRHTQRAATIAIDERVDIDIDIDIDRVDDVDTNIERVNATSGTSSQSTYPLFGFMTPR